ncbi:hypothetical protein LCGC14_0610690 [marine sediment metagenome]|uniref:Uncharacterized protein n=1 Tax=marine sediment metagenome TaxID=412755 RepID=A0A0F9RCE1_9ZZZZ
MSERDGKTNTLLIEILIGIIAEIIVVILFLVNILIPIIIGIIIFMVLILRVKKNELFIINRIIFILKKYEKIKYNNQKEIKKVREFGILLDNGREKLEKLGFNIKDNGDTIKNNFFGIHLTRRNRFIYQFLIRKLEKGQSKRPDEAYFSEGYPESQKEGSRTQVLYNFIEYLKTKRKISKLLKFFKIKK